MNDPRRDLLGVEPAQRSKPRDRSRDNAGRSENSFIKHETLRLVLPGQVGAYRQSHPTAKMLIVDANAGDGSGVPRRQLELFDENLSIPTPGQVVRAAWDFDCSCVLCERNPAIREQLQQHFPSVPILRDNREVPGFVAGFDHVTIIADPCGPSGFDLDMLTNVATRVRSDFILIQNVAAISRINGTHDDGEPYALLPKAQKANRTSRALYGWQEDPVVWTEVLGRKHVSVSPIMVQSSAFHAQIIVVANHLSEAARRSPFKVLK